MKKILSPNFDERPAGTRINCLVLHYTDMETAAAAINHLKNPEAKVSAHYVVDEDGSIIQMVDEQYRAWHAGKSSWRGKEKLNDFSIGIEIVNPGHRCGYRPFPEVQMRRLAELSAAIIKRHEIPARNVVAHSDIAPERKKDPGELFDWQFLAENGVGLWHQVKYHWERLLLKPGDFGGEVWKMQKALKNYGYKIPLTQQFDEETKLTVMAFQRHFLPFNRDNTREITGLWTALEQEIIEDLLRHL